MKQLVVFCLGFLMLVGCQMPVSQSVGSTTSERTVVNWSSLNIGSQYFVKYVGNKWLGTGMLYSDYFLVVNYGWVATGETKAFVANASIAVLIRSQGSSPSYDPSVPPDELMNDTNFQISYSVFDGSTVSSNTVTKSAVGMARITSPSYSNSNSVITTQLRVGFSSEWMAANVSAFLGGSHLSDNTYQIVNITPPPPISYYHADVNGDHNSDQVTVQDRVVTVALGNTDGTLGAVVSTSGVILPNNLAGVVLSDVNGDGRADLVAWSTNNAGDWGPGQVVVGLSLGTGTAFTGFQQWTFSSGKILPSNLLGIAFADVNGDGRADLAAWSTNNAGDWGPGQVVVGLSLGTGTSFTGFYQWTSSSGKILPSNLASVALADMNADGRADLVVKSTASSGDWVPRTTAIGVSLGSGTSFSGFQQWTSSYQE